MAYFLRHSPVSPEAVESRLEHPLAWRQLSSVFTYVFMEMRGDPLDIDQRWDYERQISIVEQTRLSVGGAGSAIENLKELLGQIGFEVQIPDITRINSKLASLQEERSRVKRGTVGVYSGQEKFKINEIPYTIMVDGQAYELTVKPVNAKPNLNIVDVEALERYMMYLGLTETKAEKLSQLIVDFRDSDSNAIGEGSEGPYRFGYNQLVPTLNRRFNRFDVLSFLPGFDVATIDLLRRHFVLQGDDGRINWRYQTVEALAAYADIDVPSVEKAIEYQKRKIDPAYNQTLETLIGSENAKKWESKVADAAVDGEPQLLELRGRKIALQAVFDPVNRVMLSITAAAL